MSNFLLGQYDLAKNNFNEALLFLRGNFLIDYDQLGLSFRLYSCEILFNRGLCFLYMASIAHGLSDLDNASQEKQIEDHEVIDEALRDQGVGYTVFSIPVGLLYRPDESKVRNMAVRDYLGKARLIAATDVRDVGTGFRGFEKKSEERAFDLPAATHETLNRNKSTKSLFEILPVSQHVLPLSVDQRFRGEHDKALPGFDFDIERRPTLVSSSRGLFPSPSRNNSITQKPMPALPPTSTWQSRNPDVSSSGTSSSSSSIRKDSTSSRDAHSIGRQGSSASSLRSRESSYHEPPKRKQSNRSPPFPVKTQKHDQQSTETTKKVPRRQRDSDSSVYDEIIPTLQLLGQDVDQWGPPSSDTDAIDGPKRTASHGVQDTHHASNDSKHSETRASYTLDQPVKSRQPFKQYGILSSGDFSDILDAYYHESDLISPREILARGPRVQKITCKIYGLEDTRKIVLEPFLQVKDFQTRLAVKFQWTELPKLRVKDEDGEMILLEDQDDLDDACEMAILKAQRENKVVGSMEVWVKDGRLPEKAT